MLDHQVTKLKKSQKKKGAAIREFLQANAAALTDQQLLQQQIEGEATRRGGRPTGSTVDALKNLDNWKRKSFDDAVATFSKSKMTNKLPRGGLNQTTERAKVQNGSEDEVDWTISANSARS
jgi:hypothetical protein